jgi:hypothetical protein
MKKYVCLSVCFFFSFSTEKLGNLWNFFIIANSTTFASFWEFFSIFHYDKIEEKEKKRKEKKKPSCDSF